MNSHETIYHQRSKFYNKATKSNKLLKRLTKSGLHTTIVYKYIYIYIDVFYNLWQNRDRRQTVNVSKCLMNQERERAIVGNADAWVRTLLSIVQQVPVLVDKKGVVSHDSDARPCTIQLAGKNWENFNVSTIQPEFGTIQTTIICFGLGKIPLMVFIQL